MNALTRSEAVPRTRIAVALALVAGVLVGRDVSGDEGGDIANGAHVPCAQERGQTMGECTASVTRGGDGEASVVVRFPNGFARTLRFEGGEFVSANATMSGSGSDIDWRRRGEWHLLRVDDQRYELRDDFLFGR